MHRPAEVPGPLVLTSIERFLSVDGAPTVRITALEVSPAAFRALPDPLRVWPLDELLFRLEALGVLRSADASLDWWAR